MTSSEVLPTAPVVAPGLRESLLADRTRALTRLYQRTFPAVRRHVLRRGGTDQDAQDVFHDALVVFYEKVVGETLALTAAPGTYLVAVCRHLWLRELDRRARHPRADLAAAADCPAEPAAEEATEPLPVLAYVEQLGEKCRNILLAFYYFRQPLAQIAATHAYRSVRSATVQKFKCLERLRNAVRAASPTASPR
ncbi:RNA polymerase sigma factor [Hymenobacter caeli]